ncbi:hypothetical protein VCR26J2_370174 [Vibrio coralliirubri]|nr:hypothetical protein VCR26J2_370174 [Vibrio coralliirubri]
MWLAVIYLSHSYQQQPQFSRHGYLVRSTIYLLVMRY